MQICSLLSFPRPFHQNSRRFKAGPQTHKDLRYNFLAVLTPRDGCVEGTLKETVCSIPQDWVRHEVRVPIKYRLTLAMGTHVVGTGPEGFKCNINDFDPARNFFSSILPRQDEHEDLRFPGWGDLPTCWSSSSLKDTRAVSKENPCVCFTPLGAV